MAERAEEGQVEGGGAYRRLDDPHVHVYIATVLVIGVFIGIFFFTPGNLLPLIVLAGMGGGVISTYIRIRGTVPHSADKGTLFVTKVQAYISPLVAGMLALVFHGFLASGIITGSLFPNFEAGSLKYNSLSEMVETLSPATNRDAAKAVVWAFIAGFSERLVPNVLDAVAKTAVPKSGAAESEDPKSGG